jgi:hypothetical protein
MQIACAKDGIAVEITGAEARVLLDELGDVPGKARPKVRQLYRELERAIEILTDTRCERERAPRGGHRLVLLTSAPTSDSLPP